MEGLESSALMELPGRERGWVGEHILEARMICSGPELSATTQKDCIMDSSPWTNGEILL